MFDLLKYLFIIVGYLGVCFTAAVPFIEEDDTVPFFHHGLGRIGDYPPPTNPLIDRAKGYLLKGRAKTAILNYGNFVSWDEYPAGGWGEYSYLPNLSFIAGITGQDYSSDYVWEEDVEANASGVFLWRSSDAFCAWFNCGDLCSCDSDLENYDPYKEKFKSIAYDIKDGQGKLAKFKENPDLINGSDGVQWSIDYENNDICVYFDEYLTDIQNGPNRSDQRIGLVYPWAYRPALKERLEEFDYYEYGPDFEEWTEDDEYMYYGATFQESYFTRNDSKGDWQASTDSRINTHNLDATAGDVFGGVELMPGSFVTDLSDPSPLLAHSAYSNTWPTRYNLNTQKYEAFWPGWWADAYYGDSPETWAVEGLVGKCSGSRQDDGCWKPKPGTHISDMDVYMEFDDRWAHRGNQVENNEYLQTGYPLGLRVQAMAHSYGISYAEDIMFFTVTVRNESGYDETGEWCAYQKDSDGNEIKIFDHNDGETQICGEPMIMPDGTLLNQGKGFNYEKLYLGFYMDADVLAGGLTGWSGLHSNADDFMEYIDCVDDSEYYPKDPVTGQNSCKEVAGEQLRVSMATIYDYDGNSGVSDIGMVAVQLLDSPLATENIYWDDDDIPEIEKGQPLKMTDWHWFDWYNRPGVVNREGNQGSSAGGEGSPQAPNKEEINYKLMSGDTTNLSENEKRWFFHTSEPSTDLDEMLNPHFDSLEGLTETSFFTQDPDGLDCVLEMTSGPFDLAVGEQVSFSFSIIFGQNHEDLIRNAEFSQIMYNAHYQGYSPPSAPQVYAETDHEKVILYWNDAAEASKDVVTTYTDFEGYKIYKSIDSGNTWGTPDQKIYDDYGIHVGWQPYAQYDLSAEADSSHCIKGFAENGIDCETDIDCNPCKRNINFKGPDPLAPWFSLGDDTGFDAIKLEEPKVVLNLDPGSSEYMDTIGVFQYAFIDSNTMSEKNVIDGIQYSYSVVAYDIGVMAADTVFSNGQIMINSLEDPGEWSKISPYQYLENAKGTTVYDINFVSVIPGYKAKQGTPLSAVKVVPNPYIVSSMLNETEYLSQIRFTKVPQRCNIKIYTVTGEFVYELNHDANTGFEGSEGDDGDGNVVWDLRTINNQEVSPGLYIYAIKDLATNKSHVGKFAIVR